jgi:hypothetical protein
MSSAKIDERTKNEILGRCMRDALFRAALLRDPEGTLKDNGFPADAEVVKAIKSADKKTIEAMASQFETKSTSSAGSA